MGLRNEDVKANSSRKVLCPLLSGLLSSSQPHWIPLKMAPLTIEHEINPLYKQYLDTTAGNIRSGASRTR